MADETKPRRTFFGACIALLTFGLVKPKPKLPDSPWAHLEPEQWTSVWDGLAAWESWANKHWHYKDEDREDSDNADVGYYLLFCEAIEQDRKLRHDNQTKAR